MIIAGRIRSTTAVGHQIALTITVRAANMSPAVAVIATAVGQVTPSPPSTIGNGLPPGGPVPTFPITTVSPGSLSSLFPVVTPSPGSAAAANAHSHHQNRRVALVSSAVPLDPRLIGGQLVGLAVLAAAITMVVVRLSLRTPHPAATGTNATGKGSPAADSTPPSEPPA